MKQSAWLWPLARAAAGLSAFEDWPRRADLDALYAERTAHLSPALPALRFVPNVRKRDKRADGRVQLDALYDARIARGEVPTRERDWHDLFNALCFATFPRAKHALHQRQLDALCRRLGGGVAKLPGARTREQDALTLFDEGGVAIAATAEAARALCAAEPLELPELLSGFERAGAARAVPFGHALFEHLVEGLIAPGGGTRVLVFDALPVSDAALVDEVDVRLRALLEDRRAFLSPKEHLHLRFGRMAS